MAKTPKSGKLKVYWAEIDGLNEWIVAAPNRPAAQRAFGVRQDLFTQNLAGDETNLDEAAQALAAPCTPLRRSRNSNDHFAPVEGGADWTAAQPKPNGPKAKRRAPDRKALDKAQADLAKVEDEHRAAVTDIDAERERLDGRLKIETQRHLTAIGKAQAKVEEARQAFEAAEGKS